MKGQAVSRGSLSRLPLISLEPVCQHQLKTELSAVYKETEEIERRVSFLSIIEGTSAKPVAPGCKKQFFPYPAIDLPFKMIESPPRIISLHINRIFARHLDIEQLIETENDHKSRLIEWCQKSKRTIRFQTTQDSEATRQPQFLSKVIIDGIELGHGRGGSKKEAEQKAAWAVSQIVGNDDIGDYFMETVDMTLERYKATAADGQVN